MTTTTDQKAKVDLKQLAAQTIPNVQWTAGNYESRVRGMLSFLHTARGIFNGRFDGIDDEIKWLGMRAELVISMYTAYCNSLGTLAAQPIADKLRVDADLLEKGFKAILDKNWWKQ